jgi:hypothetical protein
VTSPSTSGEGAPAWIRWITRASLGLGVIALVITVWAVGVDTLIHHLRTIGPWFLVLLAIEATATSCEAGAVYLMTRGTGGPAWRKVCVAQFAGRAVNSVTPGANLGEALKISLLARECSPQRIVAAVMYVVLGSLVLSLGIVSAGSFITAVVFDVAPAGVIALVATGVLAAGSALLLVVLVRRGMLRALSRAALRLRLLSKARHDRWALNLAGLDARLRGEVQSDHRVGAALLIVTSQVLHRGLVWATIVASGYMIGAPELIAVLSAGVVLNWLSAIVPMGVGISEGGNGALFSIIGAPPALGVALALARRVNQIIFAVLGFAVLAADRVAHHVDDPPVTLSSMASSTARHVVVGA